MQLKRTWCCSQLLYHNKNRFFSQSGRVPCWGMICHKSTFKCSENHNAFLEMSHMTRVRAENVFTYFRGWPEAVIWSSVFPHEAGSQVPLQGCKGPAKGLFLGAVNALRTLSSSSDTGVIKTELVRIFGASATGDAWANSWALRLFPSQWFEQKKFPALSVGDSTSCFIFFSSGGPFSWNSATIPDSSDSCLITSCRSSTKWEGVWG